VVGGLRLKLTHYLPEIPETDLLLIAGDISPIQFDDDPKTQRAWMNSVFVDWLRRVPARETVWIAGNHDTWIWRDSGIGPKLSHLPTVTYLQDHWTTVGGLKIYGTPWTQGIGLPNSWWAFDLLTIPGGTDPFAAIPENIDIVVAHSPPRGIGDLVPRGGHVGSEQLLQRLEEISPKLVVTGHIHEDYGVRRLHPGSETVVANAALLDEHYRPVPERRPLTFEL
jgi:Icc-related predicted phosphoesterase